MPSGDRDSTRAAWLNDERAAAARCRAASHFPSQSAVSPAARFSWSKSRQKRSASCSSASASGNRPAAHLYASQTDQCVGAVGVPPNLRAAREGQRLLEQRRCFHRSCKLVQVESEPPSARSSVQGPAGWRLRIHSSDRCCRPSASRYSRCSRLTTPRTYCSRAVSRSSGWRAGATWSPDQLLRPRRIARAWPAPTPDRP